MAGDPQPQRAAFFPETADIETSSDAYARRFSGSAGEWFLDVQQRLTLELMDGVTANTIVDVGGGHGQLAFPLCARGHSVTVVGSADSCRHRIEPLTAAGTCTFVVGNVIDLPFENQSFDTAISFRLVTHCTQWPILINELCRVARHAVIVDYPTSQSLNCIAPALFGAKKKIETDTRHWALFRHREIADVFAQNGFRITGMRKQFFLPMVMHRVLKSRRISAFKEGIARSLGLTHRWGSPVILRAERGVA
ncbi:MAG: class I SAM-dependent methyltransferase [Verrucomicrobia bacterium]|nr:class I SAM-dependent methyltransferase [Verrucomicrobiota bacterium]MDA1088076.1 class I SAM-dependent methyltransferase [Verrucomicrobiota bacterium]